MRVVVVEIIGLRKDLDGLGVLALALLLLLDLLGLLTCLILMLQPVELLLQVPILLPKLPLLMEVRRPEGRLLDIHALH